MARASGAVICRKIITAAAVDGSRAPKAILLTAAIPHRAVELNRASAVIYGTAGRTRSEPSRWWRRAISVRTLPD